MSQPAPDPVPVVGDLLGTHRRARRRQLVEAFWARAVAEVGPDVPLADLTEDHIESLGVAFLVDSLCTIADGLEKLTATPAYGAT